MKLVKEYINFERGINPKDAMSIGQVEERKLKKYYNIIASSGLFDMNEYEWPEFSFTSKEELGPNSKLCSNDMHYGEKAEYSLGYDDGTEFDKGFYLIFENNGYVQNIDSIKDLKTFLGLDQLKEHINFERGLEPKQAMGTGKYSIPSKMGYGPYTPLFNDGYWSIEKYFNYNVNKYSLVVVSDEPYVIDWPIFFSDHTAYDYPEKIPYYVKNLVNKFYRQIRGIDVTPAV